MQSLSNNTLCAIHKLISVRDGWCMLWNCLEVNFKKRKSSRLLLWEAQKEKVWNILRLEGFLSDDDDDVDDDTSSLLNKPALYDKTILILHHGIHFSFYWLQDNKRRQLICKAGTLWLLTHRWEVGFSVSELGFLSYDYPSYISFYIML